MAAISISNLIQQEAIAQGVPPSIALAVAKQESGTAQWNADGSVVTSSANAQGVFQLEPLTAAGLGVDPTDLAQNIQGGIAYIKQMYAQFGNWPTALAAYNFGPGNVAAGKPLPTETQNYVASVTGMAGSVAGVVASAAAAISSPVASSGDVLASIVPGGVPMLAIAALIGLGALAWWLAVEE